MNEEPDKQCYSVTEEKVDIFLRFHPWEGE